MGWSRPGLLPLSNLAGPVQHFKTAILDAGAARLYLIFAVRQGFRSGPLLYIFGSLQLLNSKLEEMINWEKRKRVDRTCVEIA